MGRKLVLASLLAAGLLALAWIVAVERPARSEATAESGAGAGDLATASVEARADEDAGDSRREAAVAAASGVRVLELALVRHPDDAVVAHAPLESDPPARVPEGGWLASDASGRIELELPPGTARLVVRVPGFEPAEAALEPLARELRLALVPSSGLFGRVVDAEGAPAAGAEVTLVDDERLLYYPGQATRDRPRASAVVHRRTLVTAVANERGYYFLAAATRTTAASPILRASLPDGRAASRTVELPREPVALEDLVLGEAERLRVRVTDLDGNPVPDAVVEHQGRRLGTTDAAGELAIGAPPLPCVPFVRAHGYAQRERRHDGVAVEPSTPVESCATLVELVLGPAPGATLRVLDAETRLPVYLGHGRVDLERGGRAVASSSFEPDRTGVARVRLFPPEEGPDAEPCDFARFHYEREGYLDGLLELDPRLVRPADVLELALEPDPAFPCLRGRVVRAGEPVPGLQVGLHAQARSTGRTVPWQYTRGVTDAEGRFALRWRDEPGLLITAYPHWFEWDEFGFVGPIDAARAAEGEHVLELLPAARVPAIVRGVEPEARHSYYVHVLDETGSVAVSTTVNGAPLPLSSAGEVRTALRLPSHRRVRVTIGVQMRGAVHSDGSPPVEHDPARPELPLVFDVRPLFARVSGHVAGLAPDELSRAGIAFVQPFDSQVRIERPASDGTFVLARLPLGGGELYLLRDGEGGAAVEVLARLALELDGDREGVVLAPDPSSLPLEPQEW